MSPGTNYGKVVGTYTIGYLERSNREIELHKLPENVCLEYFRNIFRGINPLYPTECMR